MIHEEKVLVIIVTFNPMKWAKRCFDSLRESSYPVDVFVVDNGSSDGCQDFICSHYPEVIFYQSETNLGFGKANNKGLKYALENGYEYVYLLNQDAWIGQNAIFELVAVSSSNRSFGILSPIQMKKDELSIERAFLYYLTTQNKDESILNDAVFGRELKPVYEIPFVQAAHWFIPVACVKAIGGFSPSFPHYGEDNDYANRVLYHGYKIGVVPTANCVHDCESRGNNSSKKQQAYRHYINAIMSMSLLTGGFNFMSIINSFLVVLFVQKNYHIIYYSLKLINERKQIIANRELAKNGFAFLE